MIWNIIITATILFLIFSIKDIRNYIYTRNCFRLAIKDTLLKRTYDLKMTRVGVLYTFIKIPQNTPEAYHDDIIVDHLKILDDSLIAMNLDGIITYSNRQAGDDDKFVYYLAKFIPTFKKVKLFRFFLFFIISAILWYIITKFDLLQYWGMLVDEVKSFLHNLKP